MFIMVLNFCLNCNIITSFRPLRQPSQQERQRVILSVELRKSLFSLGFDPMEIKDFEKSVTSGFIPDVFIRMNGDNIMIPEDVKDTSILIAKLISHDRR